MDSKFAFLSFLEGISKTDETSEGKLVQLNYSIRAGETNLMGVASYQRLVNDFPNRVKGGIIRQENLVNMVNLLYSRLKEEASALPLDSYTASRLENLRQFEVDGVLKPDHETASSAEDLANKFFIAQEQIRKIQRSAIS